MEKPNVLNPRIIVEFLPGKPSEPYYEIEYYDLAKAEWTIGYGSYDLSLVREWLSEDINVCGKGINFQPVYTEETGHFDSVGGYHCQAEGWNPHNVYCGECTEASCENCSGRNLTEFPFAYRGSDNSAD